VTTDSVTDGVTLYPILVQAKTEIKVKRPSVSKGSSEEPPQPQLLQIISADYIKTIPTTPKTKMTVRTSVSELVTPFRQLVKPIVS
jgi:hypothetical protein